MGRILAINTRVEAGRALIASYGCGSCHAVPGVPGVDSQEIDPGNAMPDLGVSENEASSITAFLYRQPRIKDIFRR